MTQTHSRAGRDEPADDVPPVPQHPLPRVPDREVPELGEDAVPEVAVDDVPETPETPRIAGEQPVEIAEA
ncbi:hypothetical protein ACR9E3_17735 [Actinomycetospora sp. C-140]